MNNEARSINIMNAEHMALLAYMQRYIQSITKDGKTPGDVIVVPQLVHANSGKKS